MKTLLENQGIIAKEMFLEGASWNPASGKIFKMEKVKRKEKKTKTKERNKKNKYKKTKKKNGYLALPDLKQVILGLGWDVSGNGVDLDSSCVLLNGSGIFFFFFFFFDTNKKNKSQK